MRIILGNYQKKGVSDSLAPIISSLVVLILCACKTADVTYVDLNVIGYGAEAHATNFVRPTYPTESLSQHQSGLVVAAIIVDQTGTVKTINILQSPGPLFSKAVTEAIHHSHFSMTGAGPETLEGYGKLYYYFRLDPSPRVLTPKNTLLEKECNGCN